MVMSRPATEDAPSSAWRATLVGSIMPFFTSGIFGILGVEIFADHGVASQDGDILQHRLAAIAEARTFTASARKGPICWSSLAEIVLT
jgi:hypothetical protein